MLQASSSKTLARMVEPRKLAQHEAVFEGDIPADTLIRLAEAVVSVTQIHAELRFAIDEQGDKVLSGCVWGQVSLECQRCLEVMGFKVHADFRLVIVWDEDQAKCLPRHVDPWIVAEQEADLYLILEEELLLALPLVACHSGECIDTNLMSVGDDAKTELPIERANPFEVLKKLKKDQPAD